MKVLVTTGMVLPPGGALISMETLDADQSLTSVSYLPIADAKKVEPGMQVQVTPTSSSVNASEASWHGGVRRIHRGDA